MKKIILLLAIVILTIVSCSTEDIQTQNQTPVSNEKVLSKETNEDFCITCREIDSLGRANDSTEIDPTRPRKP